MRRAPFLQAVVDALVAEGEVSENIVQASDHPYRCRCNFCLAWWAEMGPEEDAYGNPSYGPFSEAEVKQYLES